MLIISIKLFWNIYEYSQKLVKYYYSDNGQKYTNILYTIYSIINENTLWFDDNPKFIVVTAVYITL